MDNPKHRGRHDNEGGGECFKCESFDQLRRILPPFSKVYTILRHVSKSGMSRDIDLYTFDRDGNKVYLTGYAADILDYRRTEGTYWAIRIGGVGMDMGFALVYDLGRMLYPEGCAVPEGMDYWVLTRRETFERNGGYCLRQEWL